MAWKEMSIEELARNLGVSQAEVREKQKLIQQIIKTRKKSGISQTTLAQMLEVSQSRVAQIESGIGTSRISFDVLLHILVVLGYDFAISTRKSA